MMEKQGGEDEIAEKRAAAAAASAGTPNPKKRKMAPVDGASGADVCDDVAGNILASLPARTAVVCTALSKHHRRLIRSPEFRSLQLRLAPPLPCHQIAYVATAPIRRRPEHKPVSVFHGFHMAAGAAGISGNDPVRVVSGGRYLGTRYANTCNGIVLISGEEFSAPARCILWNPAVADDPKEVTVPYSLWDSTREREYLALALGYGRSSEAYKLLMCRRKYIPCGSHYPGRGRGRPYEYSLMFYLLGDSENPKRPPKLAVSPAREEKINLKSTKTLYMEGTFYHLRFDEPVVLALDVDEETVSTIGLPGEHPSREELLEMSGRSCVVTNDGRTRTLWLLTVDHQWERRCVLAVENDPYRLDDLLYCQINGVWDCGNVLVLLFNGGRHDIDMLCLYHVATEKMYKANLPGDLAPEWGDYALCWGYRPSLVSPESIVGNLNRGKEPCRDRSVEIMQILKPVKEQELRKGRKAMLNTVCFMELLAYIMRKLPEDMQNIVEMPLIDLEYSISFSEHKVVLEHEASGSAAADGDDNDDDSDVDSDSDSASASEPESESY